MATLRGSNALTAVGRQLEADIGTYEGALLKWFVTHRRLDLVRRYGLRTILVLIAAEACSRGWEHRVELRLALTIALKTVKDRAVALRQRLLGRPQPFDLGRLLQEAPKMLEPSAYQLFADENQSVIWKELTASVLLTGATAFMMIRKAFLLGRLMELQNVPQERSLWRSYAWQFPLNVLVVTLLQESSSFIRSTTVLKWRWNVTRKIHDLYFSNMGYYRLHNCGKELEVPDPDIRICDNIREMCEANAGVAFSLCNAVVFTAAFGQAVIKGRDWKWSLLAPAFFFCAAGIITKSEPWARWPLWHRQFTDMAKYTQLLTRMQLHAERICMLQGEGFEMSLLRGCIDQIYSVGRQLRHLLVGRNVVEGIIFSVQNLPSLLEQMAWFMGSVMGANDVIAGAVRAGTEELLPLDPHTPGPFTAPTLGVIVTNLWTFLNTCNSWSTVSSTYWALQHIDAANTRIKELYGRLVLLRMMGNKDNERIFLDQGPVISFDGVSVQTPTGQSLLQQLTFKVEEGESLLICGHNGSGKSSIIRCLCALWSVPRGKITRPGGAMSAEDNLDLHKEMYYLPQKPCNVLGSLSDQLTYPEKADIPEDELRRWLRYVDLEYLVDRNIRRDAVSRVKSSVLTSVEEALSYTEEGKQNEVDWEMLLSLGEQQALSIARMLYHRPRFAVLDECTSAVGKTLERTLFQAAREIGVTCISITHRPALKEHHDQMLLLTGRLAQDHRGWELSDLPEGEGRAPMRPRTGDVAEVHRRLEACLEARRQAESVTEGLTDRELEEQRSRDYLGRASAVEQQSAEAAVRGRWPSSLARFCAVMNLGLQTSAARRHLAGKLTLSVILLRFRISLGWRMWRGMMGMCSAGICGDKILIFCELFANFFPSLICVLVEQWFKLEVQDLGAVLWRDVTRELQNRLVQQVTFMEIMNPQGPHVPTVESPIQRLTELKRLFDVITGQFLAVAIPMSQAMWMLPLMFRGVGLWAPMVLALNYLAFRVAQFFAPDFAKIQAVQATLESRFQVLHTRLKTIAEPVAFSGAGAAERRIIEPRFAAIMKFERRALRKQFIYNAMVQYFTEYSNLPMWTHRLMAIRYVTANNPNDPRGLTSANIVSNILFDRSTQWAQTWVQRCVMFVPEWRRIDAHCLRVLEVIAALDLAAREQAAGATRHAAGELGAEGKIVVRGLDLVTRRGRCLAKDLSFDIDPDRPTLVTGPNASGKSLLGAVLLGVWAPSGADARISIPGALGPRPPLGTIMPSPQRVYLPVGNLYTQLLYPEKLGDLQPPFELVAYGFPVRPTVEFLQAHFAVFQGVSARVAVDEDTQEVKGLLVFHSLEQMFKALAKPQDRRMGAEPFKVDISRDGSNQPSSKVSFTRMRDCFLAVGIDGVLTREQDGWLAERQWEDVLSGGEQQRLCFARVLYHRPTFALLDECTSMIAADAEADLYRVLSHEWEVTPVTLTQRLFMPDLYKRELRLGVRNPDGWEVAELR